MWTRNEAKSSSYSYSAPQAFSRSLPPHPVRPSSSSSTTPMATAVSLPLPRRASSSAPVAAGRRPGSPSLRRRRHCAVVTPVAAACRPDADEEGSGPGRRQVLVAGAAAAAAFVSRPNPAACELPFQFTIAFKCSPSAGVPTYLICWSLFTWNMVYLVKTECHSDLL